MISKWVNHEVIIKQYWIALIQLLLVDNSLFYVIVSLTNLSKRIELLYAFHCRWRIRSGATCSYDK